ncbi:hypothetical protein [Plantactinospora veratri]
MAIPDAAPRPQRSRTFFGQPPLLANLFGVELWERFSFYGMQGILLIYLYYASADGGLGISRDTATSIVGAYGGWCTSPPCSPHGWPTGCSVPNGYCSTAPFSSWPDTSPWRCCPACSVWESA